MNKKNKVLDHKNIAIELDEIIDLLNKTTIVSDITAAKIDNELKAFLSGICKGMSPIEIIISCIDWSSHLAIAPGKQLQLAQSLIKKLLQLGIYTAAPLLDQKIDVSVSKLERRVSSENWQQWPFNVFAQAHQSSKDWWQEATSDVAGASRGHQELVKFAGELVLDMMSPANFLVTNPDIHKQIATTKGNNLILGLRQFIKDVDFILRKESPPLPDEFIPGQTVAITPGKIVFKNELIELIQYSPNTEEVGAEPVLFCPAWIMKFYILDLSPKNSMVKYLVDQGKTVFMISWKNPLPEDRDIGFEDYLTKGFFSALDVVNKIVPRKKVNVAGYCIGGTLLLAGAAAMARDGDTRLQTISIFAAQCEFSEAGEIQRFISDSQLEFTDKYMWKKGLLGSDDMGGTFSALRASDLIYGNTVNRYLMGSEMAPNDLMAWNADGTRMPYRMHTEYLHKLFLHNELARNKLIIRGKPVSLADITVPIFALGTETDHVAPWKSVYKLQGLTNTELTFLLTSGGHNAGVISGPSHPRRRYRMHTRIPGDKFMDADTWKESIELNQGSWWPAWNEWLDNKMTCTRKPPRIGSAGKGVKVIEAAPGSYVFG